MKVYITKYALTSGIEYMEVEQCRTPGMVSSIGPYKAYFCGEEWHVTFADAKEKAEDMRDKRIKSLNKSLNKLLAMKFEDPA